MKGYDGIRSMVLPVPVVRERNEELPDAYYFAMVSSFYEALTGDEREEAKLAPVCTDELLRFLLHVGFPCRCFDFMITVQTLMLMRMKGVTFSYKTAYEKIASVRGTTPDAVRNSLSYVFRAVYPQVRDCIVQETDMYFPEYFSGNKATISALCFAFKAMQMNKSF